MDKTKNYYGLRFLCIIVMLFYLTKPTCSQDVFPFKNPDLLIEKRISDLISRMTLEEKAAQMYYDAPAIERLGVPVFNWWNQCMNGVWATRPATLFPTPIAMSATWNPELIQTIADAIADEARALYNIKSPGMKGKYMGLVYRAPVVDLSRDPRWGRIHECFGEDPFLSSAIGVAYVKGLQGNHPKYLKLATTLKHFVINNQETDRVKLKITVDKRNLMDYWTVPFGACVTEGHTTSVMAAYNTVNGLPCVADKTLLTNLLRNRWNFNGFVVSDTNGLRFLSTMDSIAKSKPEAVAKAVLAGCDLGDREFLTDIPTAVKQGLLTETELDQALTRFLNIRFRLGAFDPDEIVPFSKIPESVIDCAKHRELSLKASRASIVLLKNENNFLPLSKEKIKRIAIIGPSADTIIPGQNTARQQSNVTSILKGFRKKLNANVEITYTRGSVFIKDEQLKKVYSEVKLISNDVEKEILTHKMNVDMRAQAVTLAKNADIVILCVGTSPAIEYEGRDRSDIALTSEQDSLVKAVVAANRNTIVVLTSGGPVAVPWIKENTKAILQSWWSGEEHGTAIAETILGENEPSGRLPYTIYATTTDLPPMSQYDISKGFTYLYYKGRPLWPFGYGLSYTTYQYSRPSINAKKFLPTDTLNVSFEIENNGRRAGNEVVQLYIKATSSKVYRPIRQLYGFSQISLTPDEKKIITIPIPISKIRYYDVTTEQFIVEPGNYELQIGSSANDIKGKCGFNIVANKQE